MNLLKAIVPRLKTISEEMLKPESFSEGEEFENHLRKYTFPKEQYDLLDKTHNHPTSKEDFSESSPYPDYRFRCRKTGKEFYVEAEFREGKSNQKKSERCKPFQLKRYKEIDRDGTPVFLALGIGASPSRIEEIFIIPLANIEFNTLFNSLLNKYKFYLDKPVFFKRKQRVIKGANKITEKSGY